MKRIPQWLRRYFSFGLVEQSQVVASTAVVVAMMTIIGVHFFIGKGLKWLDFVSIVTVGIIGFVSVFFSLKYGRQLEEQRRELLALNTVAEAVNHSVELEYVLQGALQKVVELMGGDFGWLYLIEGHELILKHRYGSTHQLFPPSVTVDDERTAWIQKPYYSEGENIPKGGVKPSRISNVEGMESWASIPLERKGQCAGVLIIGSKKEGKFSEKQLNLLQAFGNQINVALHNASLFEQMRQSEQRYADLFEHSPDMYHSVNRDGVVVSCNVTESVVLGYAKDEIIGKPLARLYPGDQEAKIHENFHRLFVLGEEIHGIEEQMRRKDGTLIDVSVNTSLVYDAEGKPILARMVARDITEKKKLEQEILHAQKIDSIGNLAGGVAHDFNNILSSILGTASMIKRKLKETDPWYSYIELMETASRRGASLTRQLLTFARKSNVSVRPLNMNTVIQDTLRLFEPSISKTIHITTKVSAEPVILRGDEGQLQQALLNLCINARDAMPQGGTITITTAAVELSPVDAARIAQAKPGSYVTVSVMDNGAGIPRELHAKVFEPFFTTKEREKGTGLGLSVVYGVVRGHGGFLTLESEVNVGTKVTLYFPLVAQEMDVRWQTEPHKIPHGTERILLVDDEASINLVGGAMLKDLGYTVETVHDGLEAINRLRASSSREFSLVILDMNMPRLGGKETFDNIKQLFPDLKILICTGYSDGMLDDGDFMKNVDGFLQKPYTIQDMAYKVREVLDSNGRM
jgi:PAS domain S-box-containing protein